MAAVSFRINFNADSGRQTIVGDAIHANQIMMRTESSGVYIGGENVSSSNGYELEAGKDYVLCQIGTIYSVTTVSSPDSVTLKVYAADFI